MSSKTIKVGVIGVGSLGQWHARIYSEIPEADLVGVYDADFARATEIAERYHTRPYRTMAELAEHIEAASIVVPAEHHCAIAKEMLEHGIHLLVEKPIATRTADAETMVSLAQSRKLILQVGHVERFNPVLRSLEEIMVNPRFIEAHRLAAYPPPRPGLPPRGTEISVVLDLMIHDLEIILHLVRAPLREIHAVGVPVLSATEDIANVRLTFQNGCVANVTTSRISPEPMRKIRIFQEDAYISLDYQKQEGQLYRKQQGGIVKGTVPVEKGEPLAVELASFVDCVSKHDRPLVDGEQGVRALQLATEICRQIREQKL
ncbi:MAG: Gfo/Idh/MocA family oxidoreductase [Lentisphaerae bacterium]|nr:Gfo/Idh/MocA family oxidoreductase [Lentisphaerota bacterium]